MTKVYRIENTRLSVDISSLGAEMISIYNKSTAKQMLWQPNAEIWSGQAPVLFPFIGRLKSGKYTHEGTEYEIASHGFARKNSFEAIQHGPEQIEFFLTDTQATRAMYPFSLRFAVRYSLRGSTITKEHITSNLSNKTMYFEVGGHEGYNLDLCPGAKMTDYHLRFDSLYDRESIETYTTDRNMMINPATIKIPLKNGTLPLHMELFANDALILPDMAGTTVELWNKAGPVARVYTGDFCFMGLWTKYLTYDTKFLCIEPWSSLPDCNFLDYELVNKIGVRALDAVQCETLSYTMSF
ncbi:MAG: aldose 1-epimerase family protein [Clostridia bacterium]|nr:aldose 1-epimerase family protein [Clostridia bacterium]